MEYQKILLKRLLKMIEDNERELEIYKGVQKKLNKYRGRDEVSRACWSREFQSLSETAKRAYYNNGKKYKKSEIQRVRIELNKAMIEWEKGE